MKYYFADTELAYTKSGILALMNERGIDKMTVRGATPVKVPGYRWCKIYGMASEDHYSKFWCENYQPRNGKSGMCRNQGRFFEETGETFEIEVSGKVRRFKI